MIPPTTRPPLIALALALVAGCATTAVPERDGLDARFGTPQAAQARTLAADLFARSTQARKTARVQEDAKAREVLRRRAELWLQAAEAEAARIVAERQRAELAAAREREQAASARLRRAIAAEQQRARAQQRRERTWRRWRSAHAQAKLWRRRPGEPTASTAGRMALARTLLARAAAWRSLLSLGLPAVAAGGATPPPTVQLLQASETHAARAEARIAATGQRDRGLGALLAADASLASAELALGQLRLARGETGTAQAACAWLEEARLRGLQAALGPDGAQVTLPLTDDPDGERLMTRHVMALLRLFPHGTVWLVLREGTTPAERARGRRMESRVARALRRWRTAATTGVRPSSHKGTQPRILGSRMAAPTRTTATADNAPTSTPSATSTPSPSSAASVSPPPAASLSIRFEAYPLPADPKCASTGSQAAPPWTG